MGYHARRSFRRHVWTLAAWCFLAPAATQAQNTVTPASHFGGLMYPSLAPGEQFGLQLINFTEYGKAAPSQPMSEWERYESTINETIGFNLLTISRTRLVSDKSRFDSNLLYRATLALGWSANQPTQWLQNDVVHELKGLEQVPRDPDNVRNTFEGSYSGELNYNFYEISRDTDATTHLIPSPLFAGVGFSFGTPNQEVFGQAGFVRVEWKPFSDSWDDNIYFSLSGMTRYGVLFGGAAFPEVAYQYLMSQASLALHWYPSHRLVLIPYVIDIPAYFPITLEVGATGSSGFFVSTISDPLRERFLTIHLELGSFNFEMFNDTLGDKDKGPTYGTRMYFQLVPGGFLTNAARTFPWKYL